MGTTPARGEGTLLSVIGVYECGRNIRTTKNGTTVFSCKTCLTSLQIDLNDRNTNIGYEEMLQYSSRQ